MRAEQITPAVTDHGEGPVWSQAWGGLRLVDTYEGDVLKLNQDGSVERWHVADAVTSIRPRRQGGIVLSTLHGLGVTDTVDGPMRLLLDEVVPDGQRLNDGGCDPLGHFWCGSIDSAKRGSGALFRLSPAGDLERVLGGVNVSNGIAWSVDGRYTYYADSFTGRVDRFAFADGGISGREPFITVAKEDGIPDGICVDAEGGIWVALWEGHQVRRYSASGELDEVVELPVAKVTACTFGGADLDELWITTSRVRETDPHAAAGAVFRLLPGVKGLPVAPFAG